MSKDFLTEEDIDQVLKGVTFRLDEITNFELETGYIGDTEVTIIKFETEAAREEVVDWLDEEYKDKYIKIGYYSVVIPSDLATFITMKFQRTSNSYDV